MYVVFNDVEQGDSTLIVLENKTVILVDCNYYDDRDFIKLKNLLSKSGIRENIIDILIITHPHEDHIRGIKKLSEVFSIKSIYESGHRLYISEEKKSVHYLDMISVINKTKKAGGIHKILKAYEQIFIDYENAMIQVFSPTKAYLSEENPSERDIHDECLVFKIEENGQSILFAGDSSMTAWKERIVPYYSDIKKGNKNLLKSTILHASHHGSNTFFFPSAVNDGDPYLTGIEKVNPNITIISAGVKNMHGHPDRQALEYYKRESLSEDHVFQTKHLGLIYFQVNKDNNYKIFCEEFKSKMKAPNLGNSELRIEANPLPDSDGSYSKEVTIKFRAIINNKPSDQSIKKIKWSVQNNSTLPDHHHDMYVGQEDESLTYINKTAYSGSHTLLCEIKNVRGSLICSNYLIVNVR